MRLSVWRAVGVPRCFQDPLPTGTFGRSTGRGCIPVPGARVLGCARRSMRATGGRGVNFAPRCEDACAQRFIRLTNVTHSQIDMIQQIYNARNAESMLREGSWPLLRPLVCHISALACRHPRTRAHTVQPQPRPATFLHATRRSHPRQAPSLREATAGALSSTLSDLASSTGLRAARLASLASHSGRRSRH